MPTYPHTFSFTYTPHVPSPLSSSPLRPSPTPSPLSDRDPNTTPFNFADANNNDHKMSSPTPSPSKPTNRTPFPTLPPRNSQASLPSPPPSRGKESVFSKRISKPNPLLNGGTREEKAETRRKLFLKKVKEGAAEKKWERRGGDEEIMRVLWASEERERRIRERVLAETVGGIGVEEELDMGIEEEMADEVAVREERELEALVGDWMAESSQEGYIGSQDVGNRREEHYGSDEEDYDQVFLEMMEDERRVASQRQEEDHDMMDMS